MCLWYMINWFAKPTIHRHKFIMTISSVKQYISKSIWTLISFQIELIHNLRTHARTNDIMILFENSIENLIPLPLNRMEQRTNIFWYTTYRLGGNKRDDTEIKAQMWSTTSWFATMQQDLPNRTKLMLHFWESTFLLHICALISVSSGLFPPARMLYAIIGCIPTEGIPAKGEMLVVWVRVISYISWEW